MLGRDWPLHVAAFGRLAIFGLLVLTWTHGAVAEGVAESDAQPHAQQAQSNETTSNNVRPKPASPDQPQAVPNAEQEKPASTPYKYECDNPKSREEADSCQQRRSADAATDTVTLARNQIQIGWAGVVGSLIGAMFTAWAAIAASQASRAAIRSTEIAQRSVDLASEVFVAEHRPWVKIEMMPIRRARHGAGRVGFMAEVRFTNVGKSPALDVAPAFLMDIIANDFKSVRSFAVAASKAEWYRGDDRGGFALMPNESFAMEVWQKAGDMPEGERDGCAPFVSVAAAYTAQMIEGPRVSVRVWHVSLFGGPLEALLEGPDDDINAELIEQAGATIFT